ncbi:hypothetical protein [Streptomyces sp. NPDC053367]|uniref:hypothetical protein n=1 Tax=Streptomyces sp. NPDC053367 TaxID=3365700 RepID=UPI0037D756BA
MSPEVIDLWTALGGGLIGGIPGVVLAAVLARRARDRDRRYERAYTAYQQAILAMLKTVELISSIRTADSAWPDDGVRADWTRSVSGMRAAMVQVTMVGPPQVAAALQFFCCLADTEARMLLVQRGLSLPTPLVPQDDVVRLPTPANLPGATWVSVSDEVVVQRTSSRRLMDEVAALTELALDQPRRLQTLPTRNV